MNTQQDFNVLNLRPDLGERRVDSWVSGATVPGSRLNPGLKGALGVLLAQVIILSVGALFWGLVGVPLAS